MANSTTQKLATPLRSRWPRYLLLIIITIAFFFLNQPLNLASIFVFVMLLLGTPVFEFLYKYIDDLDPLLRKSVKTFLLKLLSLVNRSIDAEKYLGSLKGSEKHEESKNRLVRVYTIVITLIFVGELLYPITHDFLSSQASSLNDAVCVSNTSNIQLTCDNGLGVEPYTADDGTIFLGLINQGGPFDHSNMNGPEEQVETRIFHENATACKTNHITLAFVTMLSRTVNDITLSAQVGLDDLHGAYLAQKDYNSVKQHQTKLCLVIGNAGTRLTTAQTVPLVLERVVRYAKHDPTFRGIVGFPFSGAAQTATDTLKAWGQTGFPLVSPSASSDQLDNIENFYRVVSPNFSQSEEMVQFLEQEYQTRQQATPVNIAVFRDSQDSYSSSLSNDFMQSVANDQPNIHAFPEGYQIQNASSLDAPLKDALQQNANFIYFAGYAYDLDALEEKLQAHEDAGTPPIPILGGDGLYDLSRYINNTYSLVYSTVYASPIETTDSFASAYEQLFGPTPQRTATQAQYSLLPPHSILSYDATTTYLKALDDVLSHGEDQTQANMNTFLATIAFIGKSGPITFQGMGNSNPLAKPVYILCTDRNHLLREAAELLPGQPTKILITDVANCT